MKSNVTHCARHRGRHNRKSNSCSNKSDLDPLFPIQSSAFHSDTMPNSRCPFFGGALWCSLRTLCIYACVSWVERFRWSMQWHSFTVNQCVLNNGMARTKAKLYNSIWRLKQICVGFFVVLLLRWRARVNASCELWWQLWMDCHNSMRVTYILEHESHHMCALSRSTTNFAPIHRPSSDALTRMYFTKIRQGLGSQPEVLCTTICFNYTICWMCGEQKIAAIKMKEPTMCENASNK